MIDESKIEELKAKHGEIFTMEICGTGVAFRLPTEPEYFKCLGEGAKNPAAAPKQVYDLAHKCVVYPSSAEFGALCSRRAGVGLKVGNEILKIAGGEETELAKKA